MAGTLLAWHRRLAAFMDLSEPARVSCDRPGDRGPGAAASAGESGAGRPQSARELTRPGYRVSVATVRRILRVNVAVVTTGP